MVSPNFDHETVSFTLGKGLLHLPGVFTATEAQTAFAAGCRMLKLFPMETGGPAYLKALRAPLNDIEFVPTGGVSLENIAEYARAGAVATGLGIELRDAIVRAEGDLDFRGTLGVAPANAIHLACAAQAGTDLFLTNDKRLVGKIVPGIQFIASLDTQLL